MTKPSITKRTVKNAALTYAELDENFQNLRDATISLTAGTGGTAVVSDLNGNITLVAGTGVTLTGDNTAKTITITNSSLGANAFGKIVVAGQSDVDADSTSDSLTLVAGSNVTLTTDSATDSITIATSVSGITNPLTSNLDTNNFNIFNNDTDGEIQITSDNIFLNCNFLFVSAPPDTGAGILCNSATLGIRINTDDGAGNGILLTESAIFLGTSSGNGTIYLDNKTVVRNTITLPVYTTTERNALSASDGMMIYNSTDNKFQGRAGGSWVDLH